VREVSHVLSSGAKLTKADAARAATYSPEAEQVAEQIRRWVDGRNGTILPLSLAAAPASAGNKQIQGPPQGCGCTDDGGTSCDCGVWRDYCFCLLCYVKTKFPELSSPDPVLGGGRMTAPGAQGSDFVLLVVAPPDADPQMRRRLIDFGLKTLKTEPFPAGLTIKTKGSPQG